ncbi:RNA polymerase-associated protein RapA [Alteromonas flava]|uniref:RNA polymerase-associated protein RapA n=1 Tax=Alteromonas flava TaxID=2048003 RepID=UPI000C284170|nr:RNA polymerase-associated protein RapA [Alteromonas flava]
MGNNDTFAVGQRWISNTEPDLGLGAIMATSHRTVDILFPATEEQRTYSLMDAPLTRLTFAVGDTIKSHEGWDLLVSHIEEQDGVLSYHGIREDTKQDAKLHEIQLDHHIRLNQPEKRLFSGQLDDPKWFDLRHDCLHYQHQHYTSPTLGLAGARLELIPHQIHIASEVGKRYAPRVLLADEVGLGKTIEAALIAHQQIQTGRAQRILIVVPDSLVHQWLVEMLRRVNLSFAVFDDSRYTAIQEEQGTTSNPFETEQLVLCSLDFFTANPDVCTQAVAATWDLLIVDEAHHLQWQPNNPSLGYQIVEQLASATKGVLLLTATPDQLGHESHFARLRLLDPARFHDYAAFLQEEAHYGELATAVEPLLNHTIPSASEAEKLQQVAGDWLTDEMDLSDATIRETVIDRLIDQHGTGRVLFRNRRAAIQGFPSRRVHPHPLEVPSVYQTLLQQHGEDLAVQLHPEQQAEVFEQWLTEDPRVAWLLDFLAGCKPQKVLVICASAVTAQQLAEHVRVKTGIRQTVFHEGMSLLERDKAAHYFAQVEDGAQVLICSEIGSEGRNFQFANQLVLFDLPMVPDLLEQRIGRLDRIGQTQDIDIHVPFFNNASQARLFDWYQNGLNAFEKTCPIGTRVFEEVRELLFTALLDPLNTDHQQRLIEATQELHQQYTKQLEQGRDKLLEINASGLGKVDPLLDAIAANDVAQTLPNFMNRLLDALGVQQEEKDAHSFVLMPTESMVNHLPGLDHEGMEVTYRRTTATRMEHLQFISWDHPLVHNAMDVVLTDVLGKSSMAFIKQPELPKGAYFVQASFTISGKAPRHLQLETYLPATPILVTLDAKGQAVDLTPERLFSVNKKVAMKLLGALKPAIQQNLEHAERIAHQQANQIQHDAIAAMHKHLGGEAERLSMLAKHNPSIRPEEITFIEAQVNALNDVMQSAQLQLDAIRLLVNNP